MANAMERVTPAILAGGLGTRLRSKVAGPKALAPVRGRPFITYLLDQLGEAGAEEVVLLTGHGGEQVLSLLGERYWGLRLRYSREPAPLGTAGAVRHALPLLDRESVLLLNGDSYCEADLTAFADGCAERDADAGMVLARVGDTVRFGRVVVEEGGRVERFEEKAACGGPGWINAGVYLLPRARVAGWASDRPLSLEREVLPQLVAAGRVWGQRCEGGFLDIGTPESFEESEKFFGHLAPLAPLGEGLGVRGRRESSRQDFHPLTPNPSSPRGRGEEAISQGRHPV